MRHLATPYLFSIVAACAQAGGASNQLEVVPASGRPARVPPKLSVDSLLETLTVREKVGQLIMPWLSGRYVATEADAFDTAAVWVERYGVGGIIISIGSPLDAAAKLNRLQERSRLPLMVAADLEFGAAMRMVGATAFPMPMALGATNRELDAYQLGRITALEARAVGIHWTFSPVADVNSNPANPIINTRSFGEAPEAVARLASAYIRGASEHGLLTTAKHFPGHGDTGTDSHIELPVLDACWDRLDTLELVPFRAAIESGVTSVMTAHIALPCFDPDAPPATLSSTVMTGILRDSLGFDGIVLTDALDMGAIVNRFGSDESVVLAFLAGSDLLLMPDHIGAAVEAMVTALNSGRISHDRLDRSVRRMLLLKQEVGLYSKRTVKLDSIPATVGRRDHQEIADDIAARALTLVQRGQLQLFRDERARTAVITYAEATNSSIGAVLIRELRQLGDTITAFRLYPASGPMSYDSAAAVIESNPRVVFAASVRPISSRGHIALPDLLADLVTRTAEDNKPTALVSFGSPYLMSQVPSYSGVFLLAWNAIAANERAVANALAGGAPITGTLPITLSDRFGRGHGITVEAR